jgi:ATP-dependent helicase Lhr and Lhr-like helicase
MMKLVHKDFVLGEIPRVSLRKAGKGTPVLFAARKWIIQKIEEDTIHLVPIPPEAFAWPLSYVGLRPEFDAFLTDKMWSLIHTREFPYNQLHKDLEPGIDKARRAAQALFTVNEIPYTEQGTVIRYYTFGGILVNTAIALLQGETDLKGVTDCFLEVSDPVDWESLPSDPSKFESIFRSLAKQQRGRSFFQALLPRKLQVREGIQEWLCDEAIGKVLRRLKQSKPLACISGDRPFPLEQPVYLLPAGN